MPSSPVGVEHALRAQGQPAYGTYTPSDSDVKVERRHIQKNDDDAISYWKDILSQCTESEMILQGGVGERDVFALGNMIIKSSHLHEENERDFALMDKNEGRALQIGKHLIPDVRVPKVYLLHYTLDCRKIVVLQRLEGAQLSSIWTTLDLNEKQEYKRQARQLLRQLRFAEPTDPRRHNSFLISDNHPVSNQRCSFEEWAILAAPDRHPDLSFMHNNLTLPNIIVKDGKIAGLYGWEKTGYFGWERAAEVHRMIRMPQWSDHSRLRDDKLEDVLFWNDLYDFDPSAR